MVDVLVILNTLSLAFQKQGILLVDIKHVIKIVTQIAIFFFFFGKISAISEMDRKTFGTKGNRLILIKVHRSSSILFLNKLIEVSETFDMTDFLVFDAFHVFYIKNIPEVVSPTYDIEEAKLIYTFSGNNQVNIFQE